MSAIIDIADAVVELLDDHEFSQEFTPTRSYRPVRKLEELADLCVTVVPKADAAEIASRSDCQHDYEIDIAVQQRVDLSTPAGIDDLMDLVQEIVDCLAFSQFAELGAQWVSTVNEPVVAREHLDQHQVFTSLLTATWRVRR